MTIKANRSFAPLSGTVFVVTKDTGIALGVFKTLSAARSLAMKINRTVEYGGTLAQVNVGHFNAAGDVDTI